MKAALALLLIAAPATDLRYFRYERPLNALPTSSQACLVLDNSLFAHASPTLADLRLFRDNTETPFVVHLDAPAKVAEGTTSPLNLGVRNGETVFDASMPHGTYSDLELELTAQNFLATVTVSGSHQPGGPATQLGAFTIFDFTGEKLGRSTVLHLPASDFGYLHFAINGPRSPEDLHGIVILGTAASQPRYVTVAAVRQATQKGRATTFQISVPANVPVDRIAFIPGPEPGSFTRDVSVRVVPDSAFSTRADAEAADTEPVQPVTFSGNLLRLHRMQDGKRIDEERLSLAPTAQTFAAPSTWTITVDNGDDAPLDLQSVRLEMLQRNLCFEAAAGARYVLYYGDPALQSPHYDYATLFEPKDDAARASAAAEQGNPAFQARPDSRPFTERHPVLLWTGLILVLALLGSVAFRSSRQPRSTT